MTGPRISRFDSAYPVPFRLDRDTGPRHYRLTNTGMERLHGVTVSMLGSGLMPATPPSTLGPGETLDVTISARNLALGAGIVVRWFRPSGEEYLWSASF